MGNDCSGIATAGDSFSHTTFTQQDIRTLRETFDAIKYGGQKRQLAQKCINMIFKQIPDAKDKIIHHNTQSVDETILMRRGMVFLDGIEQTLRFIDNPAQLQDYIAQLVLGHKQRYEVDGYMMGEGIDALKAIIFPYLKAKHGHRNLATHGTTEVAKNGAAKQSGIPDDNEEDCKICNTWERFFKHLKALLQSAGNET